MHAYEYQQSSIQQLISYRRCVRRTSFTDFHCSLARAVEVMGDWWTPLIVRDLYLGLDRFDDLVTNLTSGWIGSTTSSPISGSRATCSPIDWGIWSSTGW